MWNQEMRLKLLTSHLACVTGACVCVRVCLRVCLFSMGTTSLVCNLPLLLYIWGIRGLMVESRTLNPKVAGSSLGPAGVVGGGVNVQRSLHINTTTEVPLSETLNPQLLVFSVTQSFRNRSNMLIYNQCWKPLCCFIFLGTCDIFSFSDLIKS